jgi:hypothetical protein
MRTIEMKRKEAVVSKSALARELDCSPSSISALVDRGLPVRLDGKLDRQAALRWITDATTGSRGGWGEGQARSRADLRERALRLLAGDKPKRTPKPEPSVSDEVYQERLRVLRAIVAPDQQLWFAGKARQMGASPELAYALGSWYATQPCLQIEVDDSDLESLDNFPAPALKEWRQELGDFDIEAADALVTKFT